MSDLETLVRNWAQRKNIPLNPGEPLPQSLITRYQKARAYRIRQSYAKRKSSGAPKVYPYCSARHLTSFKD